ncbi:hypothetical protein [Nostoc sp. CHAB 5715]|nr:hypothetical protein [Nostoc sp. CHAB 5715]MCC5624874.1 hypothetical protein [Nostoc sp. CHAB 5715]
MTSAISKKLQFLANSFYVKLTPMKAVRPSLPVVFWLYQETTEANA